MLEHALLSYSKKPTEKCSNQGQKETAFPKEEQKVSIATQLSFRDAASGRAGKTGNSGNAGDGGFGG